MRVSEYLAVDAKIMVADGKERLPLFYWFFLSLIMLTTVASLPTVSLYCFTKFTCL